MGKERMKNFWIEGQKAFWNFDPEIDISFIPLTFEL